MQKIAVITCYKEPDYVRAKVLRSAIGSLPDAQLIVMKNRLKGVLRYFEIALRLVWLRLIKDPDIYLVTFRGYEILPFVLIVAYKKKIIFDEFINPLEWVIYEHKKIKENGVIHKLLSRSYRHCLLQVNAILTDTISHARYSASLMNLDLKNYVVLPVSTDEKVFSPVRYSREQHWFTVFYYGNMLPLHGLRYVIEAASQLKEYHDINFLLVGGGASAEKLVSKASKEGAHITYRKRVPFSELPLLASRSSLCLGGPFGNTVQSQMVVTGKTFQFLCAGFPTLVGKNQEHNLFVDRKNCLVAQQGDAQSLAKTILWAYESRAKLPSIGQAGRETYLRHYSNTAVANKLSPLIKGINK